MSHDFVTKASCDLKIARDANFMGRQSAAAYRLFKSIKIIWIFILSVESYITDVYRAVLMREPDDAGFASLTAEYNKANSLDDAHKILTRFLQSVERNKNILNGNRSVIDFKVDAIAGSQRVISIGSHCATAGTLQRFSLKTASYPFDWIFSNLNMVADCLKDDFSDFLNVKYHQSVPVEQRQFVDANFCNHALFLCRYGIEYMFNHVDISTSQGLAYYQRCARRMHDVLSDDKPTILLNLSADSTQIEGFDRLCDVLKPFPHIKVIAIEFIPTFAKNLSIFLKDQIGHHVSFGFHSYMGLKPTRIESILDEAYLREYLVSDVN